MRLGLACGASERRRGRRRAGCRRGGRSRPADRSASRRRAPRTARSKLAVEADELSLRRAAGPPSRLRRREPTLALAVVAEPPGLQDAGSPVSTVERAEAAASGCRAARTAASRRAGPGRARAREAAGRRRRPREPRPSTGHVLELVGDDVAAVGEAAERVRVVVGADDELADLRGRRLRRGSRKRKREPEREPGQRQHPAELAAAEHAERHAPRHAARVRVSSTARVCSAGTPRAARGCRRRPRARIAAASSAALTAPARPIASVPTGTPAGICTIESSESIPFSALTRPARRARAAPSSRRPCRAGAPRRPRRR